MSTALRVTILCMTAASGGLSILLAHQGLFAAIAGRFADAIALLVLGIALGTGSYLLARFRNDLIDA